VSAGVTAESIFQKSITAQGGEAAMKGIKDLTMTGTASVMGQNLDFVQKYVLPNGFLQTMTAGPNVLSKQLVKGTVYSVMQQGQEAPLEDKDKEELDEGAALFVESYMMQKGGYTFTLKGIEPVEGKDAYAIDIKSPKGRVSTYYYDVVSSLRVKEAHTEEGPDGKPATTSILTSEFKIFNGVKLPVKQVFDAGPFKLDINIKDVKVNTGLKLEDLK
jgi:hypothetical protein